MKALVVDKGEICLKEVPDPIPASDEALIKVLKAGICNTDLEIVKGYMPFSGILGHEFVGRVEDAPDKNWIGQRVVGEINLFCETCDFCARGKTKHCSSRQVLGITEKNGVFAEFLTLPVKNLHILPNTLSINEGVFIEPLSAALQVLEQVSVAQGDRILVLGDGKLGLLIARVLALHSDSVFCLGKHERNLDLLRKGGIQTYMREEICGPCFPLVIEATGNEDGLSTALQMVLPGGTVVLKSTYQESPCFDVSKIVVDEVHLIGSRCGPFPEAIELLKDKQIYVEDMIDADFPLEHALKGFDLAKEPGTLKVLLTPLLNETNAKKEKYT
jgi:threonine dehydrogenase-like Zn-dependent dehydrogenase